MPYVLQARRSKVDPFVFPIVESEPDRFTANDREITRAQFEQRLRWLRFGLIVGTFSISPDRQWIATESRCAGRWIRVRSFPLRTVA